MASTNRDALVALFRSTGGAGWTRRDNWDTHAAIGTWPHLGALEELILSSNKLDGPIPKELGDLTELKDITLFENNLTGPILPELRNLGALKTLDLGGNKLIGPIPKQLGALTKLENLWLQNIALTGPIPPELRKLAALKALYLWNSQLSGTIPKELGSLRQLRQLWISNNQLSGLWHTLGQDQASSMAARPDVIDSLFVSRWWYCTLPVDLDRLLDNFESLKFLDLAHNPWEHPPEAIVGGGVQAVRGYYEAMFMGGTTAVTRPLKVVIVGKETVGKTSLRRSITTGKPCMTQDSGV
ncbi:unnamed protein product [Ectocarpus sp. 13 AM-2016]